MVDVTVIFITEPTKSIFLFKENDILKTITKRVYKCSSFVDIVKEIISMTSFKIKKLYSTYGMSYIAIVSNTDEKWKLYDISSLNEIEDKKTILGLIKVFNEKRCFEINLN